jgi:hypothetical protein
MNNYSISIDLNHAVYLTGYHVKSDQAYLLGSFMLGTIFRSMALPKYQTCQISVSLGIFDL